MRRDFEHRARDIESNHELTGCRRSERAHEHTGATRQIEPWTGTVIEAETVLVNVQLAGDATDCCAGAFAREHAHERRPPQPLVHARDQVALHEPLLGSRRGRRALEIDQIEDTGRVVVGLQPAALAPSQPQIRKRMRRVTPGTGQDRQDGRIHIVVVAHTESPELNRAGILGYHDGNDGEPDEDVGAAVRMCMRECGEWRTCDETGKGHESRQGDGGDRRARARTLRRR